MISDVINLNAQQEDAVKTVDQSVLIVAGAGTGKTRTIIERIRYIIENNHAHLAEILAVTFTNKAANEMKTRLLKFVTKEDCIQSWIGTFHAIAMRILRLHGEFVGINNDFVIFDANDQLSIVKNIISDSPEIDVRDQATANPKFILSVIQSWKDKYISPSEAQNNAHVGPSHFHIIPIYHEYQKMLKNANALDFGDLLFFTLQLFRENQSILDFYRKKFKFVMVDEFQDTNYIQYQIIKSFIHDDNNLCCVGDDDQSIYSWRGAEITNILHFKRDFPKAKIVKIEQNYRSTQFILNAANSIIRNNHGRIEKQVWTERVGEKINVLNLYTGYDEAKFIVDKAKELKEKKRVFHYKQIAILIRSNAQSRILEEIFTQNLLPYKIIGGIKFYSRQEVKDILCYLRLLINPVDNAAFERIVNRPRRKFGTQSLKQLRDLSMQHNMSMMQALKLPEAEKLAEKLGDFCHLFQTWKDDMYKISLDDLVNKIVQESGYEMMITLDNEPSYIEEKMQNIKELKNAIQNFDSLKSFLEHIALMNEIDDDSVEADGVQVMTFHAAKGLEFDYVFLPGWEEGMFPNYKALELEEVDKNSLEEERRLAYVGITRAKWGVFITHVNVRNNNKSEQSLQISRFIEELDVRYVNFIDMAYNEKQKYNSYQDVAKKNDSLKRTYGRRKNQNKTPIHVQHKVFGIGRVIEKKGKIYTVVFKSGQTKKLVEEFVEKVE